MGRAGKSELLECEVMTLQAYKDKFSLIRVNVANKRASPHKICMLLAVLDMARSGKLKENCIHFNDPALLEPYHNYFNSVRTASDHANPYFPFFHLRGSLRNGDESFWHVQPLAGKEEVVESMKTVRSAADLNNNIACVTLDEELFELLDSAENIDSLGEQLATTWFDRGLNELHVIVSQGKKISRYENQLRNLTAGDDSQLLSTQPDAVRSPAFRRIVTEVYDYRCAATGLRILLSDGTAMVEAAHIRPFSETKDDDPRNGMALTPNIHWAYDKHLIAPGPDYKWHVSKQLDDRIPDYKMLTELNDKKMFLPAEQRMYPKQEALDWAYQQLLS